jgi:hypothetical protein
MPKSQGTWAERFVKRLLTMTRPHTSITSLRERNMAFRSINHDGYILATIGSIVKLRVELCREMSDFNTTKAIKIHYLRVSPMGSNRKIRRTHFNSCRSMRMNETRLHTAGVVVKREGTIMISTIFVGPGLRATRERWIAWKRSTVIDTRSECMRWDGAYKKWRRGRRYRYVGTDESSTGRKRHWVAC